MSLWFRPAGCREGARAPTRPRTLRTLARCFNEPREWESEIPADSRPSAVNSIGGCNQRDVGAGIKDHGSLRITHVVLLGALGPPDSEIRLSTE